MAITDQLTGLHNRRYMSRHLDTLIASSNKSGKPIAFLIFDIDHFKRVNDTYGHDIGDEVLKEFAGRIAANVRGIDLACRYGGEEFVVVMPDTDIEFAYSVAERLRKSVETTPFDISRAPHHLNVTISIGIAGSKRAGRFRGGAPSPRRPGALPRQERRPQSGCRGRGVGCLQKIAIGQFPAIRDFIREFKNPAATRVRMAQWPCGFPAIRGQRHGQKQGITGNYSSVYVLIIPPPCEAWGRGTAQRWRGPPSSRDFVARHLPHASHGGGTRERVLRRSVIHNVKERLRVCTAIARL